jgi:hypothetical protein
VTAVPSTRRGRARERALTPRRAASAGSERGASVRPRAERLSEPATGIRHGHRLGHDARREGREVE